MKKRPDKVVITITAEGISTVVFAGDQELSNRSEIMESAGCAKATKKGDIFDDLEEEFLDLAGEIDDLNFGPFGVAGALYTIREEAG
ncbi:hypothetical protein [Thiovibrio frasassiensis]|uniref:Uncharacterized protein n=1 Tax=Thiovibrio frasassiensis TaxID=2984131 RepID=A0A9X4MFK8_9BACT|nr:hypothetical protein [Thiovibrio frasassiensis]MDG4475413.1 hypothetical protein [Thiovibrio frasassiensis]